MPLVSVIVPTHNREALVREAIESALSQTHREIEVIVVDDGSTDQTADSIAAISDSRIRLFTQSQSGPAAARNAGIEKARGEFVAFLDSDDLWESGKIAAQLAVFEKCPDAVLVFSDARLGDTGRTAFTMREGRDASAGGDWFTRLLLDNIIITSTVLAKKEAVVAAGGFDTVFEPAEDYRLWLSMTRLGPFEIMHDILAIYRLHGDQLGEAHLTSNTPRMFDSCSRVIVDAVEKARLKIDSIEGLPHRLWQLHFVAGRAAHKSGDRAKAHFHYREAARIAPFSKATLFLFLNFVKI